MDDIESLMVEETRQAFYQRENLLMSVDIKAFGVIAIDAVLISVFTYISNIFETPLLFAPHIVIIISIIFLAKCIKPVKWFRMGTLKLIQDYGNLEYNAAAKGLAVNYAQLDEMLKSVYEKKFNNRMCLAG